jgi:hypothetical protein
MTEQKDFKHLVRRRMEKTGESYTTARAQLVAKPRQRRPTTTPPAVSPALPPAAAATPADAAPPHPEPAAFVDAAGAPAAPALAPPSAPPAETAADFAALAGMSDAAVRAATGCDWKAWVGALDFRGAERWSHRAIAASLASEHGLSGWWAQTVAVGYERIKGLRAKGQRRDGSFEANRARSFPVPLATLRRAWSDARTRRRWLPVSGLRLRPNQSERALRFEWPDGTVVELWFTAKEGAKSSVQVQHRGLASREAAETARREWATRLDALAAWFAAAEARAR